MTWPLVALVLGVLLFLLGLGGLLTYALHIVVRSQQAKQEEFPFAWRPPGTGTTRTGPKGLA